MTEKRKEYTTLDDRKQLCRDYLQKNDIVSQMHSGLLKLVENRPDSPMLFLADYFDSFCGTEKSDKILKAMDILNLAHHSQPAFQTNLILAYDSISVNKVQKKSGVAKHGLIGTVYQELLKSLVSKEISTGCVEKLLSIIGCKPNETVLYDIFRYGVTCCFIFLDFVKVCRNLFSSISIIKHSSDSVISKPACDLISSALGAAVEAAVTNANENKSLAILEASYQLRPEYFSQSASLLTTSSQCECVIEHEFVNSMCELYFDKLKILK